MKKLPPNATTYTAAGLIAFGLILIFFAWNGAAGPENGLDLRSQFPYLISGGLGGVSLVAAGLTLVRVFEARRDNQQVVLHLVRLTEAVERLESTLAGAQLAEANAREGAPAGAFPPPAPPFESAL